MSETVGAGTRRFRQSAYVAGIVLFVVLAWLYRHHANESEKLAAVQGNAVGLKVIAGRIYHPPLGGWVGPTKTATIASESVVDGGQKRSVAVLPASRAPNPLLTRYVGIRGNFAYYLRDVAPSVSGPAPPDPEVLIYGIGAGRIVPGYAPNLPAHGNPQAGSRSGGLAIGNLAMPKPDIERLSALHTLIRVSLKGGAPQTVGRVRDGVLTENSFFWLGVDADMGPGTAGARKPARGPCRLMETSLLYGLTRRVETGPDLAKELHAGAHEIYWSTPNPRSYPRIDLHVACEGTFVSTVLPDMPAKLLDNSLLLPVAFENRIFWREDPEATGNLAVPAQSRLMSAAPDGSDRRTVLEETVFFMAAYRGALYAIVPKVGPQSGRMLLKRLRSGEGNSLDTVRDLPSAAFEYQFDADYLYFVQPEIHQSLTDRLFHEQQATTTVTRWRRVRLPL